VVGVTYRQPPWLSGRRHPRLDPPGYDGYRTARRFGPAPLGLGRIVALCDRRSPSYTIFTSIVDTSVCF
jgi:hypothetical protein